MSKTRDINRRATYMAIMRRSKENIADQLSGILMLLYHVSKSELDAFDKGWNESRKVIREVYECDDWVEWEDKP